MYCRIFCFICPDKMHRGIFFGHKRCCGIFHAPVSCVIPKCPWANASYLRKRDTIHALAACVKPRYPRAISSACAQQTKAFITNVACSVDVTVKNGTTIRTRNCPNAQIPFSKTESARGTDLGAGEVFGYFNQRFSFFG